jgi:hypothetical protein
MLRYTLEDVKEMTSEKAEVLARYVGKKVRGVKPEDLYHQPTARMLLSIVSEEEYVPKNFPQVATYRNVYITVWGKNVIVAPRGFVEYVLEQRILKKHIFSVLKKVRYYPVDNTSWYVVVPDEVTLPDYESFLEVISSYPDKFGHLRKVMTQIVRNKEIQNLQKWSRTILPIYMRTIPITKQENPQ